MRKLIIILLLASSGIAGAVYTKNGKLVVIPGSTTSFTPAANTTIHTDNGNATANNLQMTAGTTTGLSSTDGTLIGLDTSGNFSINNQEATTLSLGTNGITAYRESTTGQVKIGDIANATAFTSGVSASFQATQARPYFSFEATDLSNPWIMDVSTSKWYFNRSQNDIGGFYLDTANHFGTGDGGPTYMVTFTNAGSANTDLTNISTSDPLVAIRNRSNTANNFSGIAFENFSLKTDSAINGIHTTHANPGTGELNFMTSNASVPVERMRISASGSVGVGTSTPVQKLEVNGNLQADGSLKLTVPASASIVDIAGATGSKAYILYLPTTLPTANQVLSASSVTNNIINLGWASSGGGGGTPNVGQFYFGDDCGSWSTNSTSYVDMPGDSTCTFTTVVSSNLGTVTPYLNGGNNSDGIIFTPVTAGNFEVCAYPLSEVHGSIQAFLAWQLLNSAGTAKAYAAQTTDISSATYVSVALCIQENIAAGSPLTYKLQAKVNGTSAAMSMGGTGVWGSTTVWTVKLVN